MERRAPWQHQFLFQVRFHITILLHCHQNPRIIHTLFTMAICSSDLRLSKREPVILFERSSYFLSYQFFFNLLWIYIYVCHTIQKTKLNLLSMYVSPCWFFNERFFLFLNFFGFKLRGWNDVFSFFFRHIESSCGLTSSIFIFHVFPIQKMKIETFNAWDTSTAVFWKIFFVSASSFSKRCLCCCASFLVFPFLRLDFFLIFTRWFSMDGIVHGGRVRFESRVHYKWRQRLSWNVRTSNWIFFESTGIGKATLVGSASL